MVNTLRNRRRLQCVSFSGMNAAGCCKSQTNAENNKQALRRKFTSDINRKNMRIDNCFTKQPLMFNLTDCDHFDDLMTLLSKAIVSGILSEAKFK